MWWWRWWYRLEYHLDVSLPCLWQSTTSLCVHMCTEVGVCASVRLCLQTVLCPCNHMQLHTVEKQPRAFCSHPQLNKNIKSEYKLSQTLSIKQQHVWQVVLFIAPSVIRSCSARPSAALHAVFSRLGSDPCQTHHRVTPPRRTNPIPEPLRQRTNTSAQN